MNVIFTCGGTAGHINPAIAVADILKERHPDCNILFIGAKGHMEEKLVPKAGYELKCLPGSGLTRGKSLKAIKKNIQVVGDLFGSIKECKKIIREFGADVIVGTGGYASFPALHAGSKLGIPTCVHESNAVPGLTTKMAANKADRVLVSFPESAQYYRNPQKVEVVGMPVRKEFILTQKEDARKELGLDSRPLVVSAFGSLGARAMNFAMAEFMKMEQEEGFPFQHIHADIFKKCKLSADLRSAKLIRIEMCFDYLDGPAVVVGSRNWITPAFELEKHYFPQADGIVDVISQKLLPIEGRVSTINESEIEHIERSKNGI